MFSDKKLIKAQNDYIKQLEKSINNKDDLLIHMQELIVAYKDSHETKQALIDNQNKLISLLENMNRREVWYENN